MHPGSHSSNAFAGPIVPDLGPWHLTPSMNAHRKVITTAGDTARVVKCFDRHNETVALRVPLDPSIDNDWSGRYARIAQAAPDGLIPLIPRSIEPVTGGMRIAGLQQPAIVMEWIEGVTLLRAVDRACSAGQGAVLYALAESVLRLARDLRTLDVTHGNITADNIMVRTDGSLVLIDLDTLTWPESHLHSQAQPAVAWRHPGREVFGTDRDGFGFLLMYTSLLALADAPELRQSFGDGAGVISGSLLFSSWDLADPDESAAFAKVRSEVSRRTRDMIDRFVDACGPSRSSLKGMIADVIGGAEAVVADADDRGGWSLTAAIDRLKTIQVPTLGVDAPTSVVGTARVAEPAIDIVEEDEREEERSRLRQAIAEGWTGEVIRLASRLADDPVAQLEKLHVERLLASETEDRILEAASRHDDAALLDAASDVERRHLVLAHDAGRTIRLAREREALRNRLLAAIQHHDHAELRHLAMSGELVLLGEADRLSVLRVIQALELPALERAIVADDDVLILAAFDQEVFERVDELPAIVRDRVRLAGERQEWLARVRKALRQRHAKRLRDLRAIEPNNASAQLGRSERERLDRIVERDEAVQALANAIREQDDTRIVVALGMVEKSGARVDDAAMWHRLQHVVEKRTLIENILAAAAAQPPEDRQLAHLLPAAKRLGLMHDPAIRDIWGWDDLEAIVARGAAVRRIRTALKSGDDRRIRLAAFPDLTGAIELLTDRERRRVESVRPARHVAPATASGER